jgi:antimicrobial peptide system SdpA family protein
VDVRRQGAVGTVALLCGATVLAVSLFFTFPSNVLSTRDGGDIRRFFVELSPQGWGFFTKPPSEPEAIPFLVESGSVIPASRLPQAKAENAYGLSRRQRAQGPELAYITSQVSNWHKCESTSYDSCLDETLEAGPWQAVDNTSPVPTLCGRHIVLETMPVPWSFRESYETTRLASSGTKVDVEC